MAPMPNKMPKWCDKHKICIICEGNEEYQLSLIHIFIILILMKKKIILV